MAIFKNGVKALAAKPKDPEDEFLRVEREIRVGASNTDGLTEVRNEEYFNLKFKHLSFSSPRCITTFPSHLMEEKGRDMVSLTRAQALELIAKLQMSLLSCKAVDFFPF